MRIVEDIYKALELSGALERHRIAILDPATFVDVLIFPFRGITRAGIGLLDRAGAFYGEHAREGQGFRRIQSAPLLRVRLHHVGEEQVERRTHVMLAAGTFSN